MLPLFEDAAKEVADEVTRPRSDGNEEVQNIQVHIRDGKDSKQRILEMNINISENLKNYPVKIK